MNEHEPSDLLRRIRELTLERAMRWGSRSERQDQFLEIQKCVRAREFLISGDLEVDGIMEFVDASLAVWIAVEFFSTKPSIAPVHYNRFLDEMYIFTRYEPIFNAFMRTKMTELCEGFMFCREEGARLFPWEFTWGLHGTGKVVPADESIESFHANWVALLCVQLLGSEYFY